MLLSLSFSLSALAYLAHFNGSFFECCVCKTKSVVDLHDTTQHDSVQPTNQPLMAMCRCLVCILCGIVVAWCAYFVYVSVSVSASTAVAIAVTAAAAAPAASAFATMLYGCCCCCCVFPFWSRSWCSLLWRARYIQCIGVSDTIPSFRLFRCSELLYIFFNSNFNPMVGYLHTQHQFRYTQLTVHISPFSMNFWPVFNC